MIQRRIIAKPKRARFWVWVNHGKVLLTLFPGQRLVHNEGGPTEEGYCWSQETWEHTGRYVVRCWAEESKDCDGRYDRYARSRVKISEIKDHFAEWESDGSSQRDYAAEAAGY